MHPLGATLPPHCFEGYVNETVAVSWHNINYPIKMEWVINCPSLAVLITLTEKGHCKMAKDSRGRKKGWSCTKQRLKNKAVLRYMHLCVSESFKREKETERPRPHWRETHVVLTWAPRGLVHREKQAYWRGERWEGGVVYLDMLYSVFNACITIKMLRLISYVYKTV